jgi:type I restriction enzyme S subunit
MSKTLPEVPLAEIAKPISRSVEVIPGQSYRTIGVKWWGEGAYERQTIDGSGTAAKSLSLVRQGDLIINKIWVRHGSTAIAGADVDGCAASGEFPTFTLDESRVAPGWLHWQTKTRGFWAKCDDLSQGSSGKNRIKPELFLTIRVPLPPLAEQRRVVARIEALAAQIHEARTLRHQAAEEANVLVTRSTEKVFAEAGESFASETLGTHVKLQGGYAFKSDEYLETGLPIVRIANLENEAVHTNGSPCMPENRMGEFNRFVLNPGDILVAMTGATTGKLGIVPENCGTWLLNQRVGRFLPKKPDELEPKYVYWLARGVQKHILETAYGGAQPNISPNDIEAMKFPFPPLAEQRRIVSELDALQAEVDALKRLQAETATELAALLPSIIDRAFKGEL